MLWTVSILTCNIDLDLVAIRRKLLHETSTQNREFILSTSQVILKSIDKCRSGALVKVNFIIDLQL